MRAETRILVVDDNRSLVRVMAGVLQKSGFHVFTAFDGEEALRVARLERPDLIVLDIVMPKLDGYEVCRRLQSDPATAAIPILMLSVKGQVDDPGLDAASIEARLEERMAGFDAGALDFLSKPIRAGELLERVNKLLLLDQV
jgi:two-component system alkaline phosphatase synthesis response regulator PhoP